MVEEKYLLDNSVLILALDQGQLMSFFKNSLYFINFKELLKTIVLVDDVFVNDSGIFPELGISKCDHRI